VAEGAPLVADHEPGTIVLLVGGRIARDDVPRLCERVRVLLEGSDAALVVCDVAGLSDPDAGTVDTLARLALTAGRLGCRIRLRHASPRLRELLALVGLDEVVAFGPGLRLEPRGQAEQREPALRLEERVEPDDATG
jgi:ABC-type transporter Mla MlaB component